MVANWEVSAHAYSGPAPDFVLICATGAPFSSILLIFLIEDSITYLFSMAVEAVPFQNRVYATSSNLRQTASTGPETDPTARQPGQGIPWLL
jgi:hypothetical protein